MKSFTVLLFTFLLSQAVMAQSHPRLYINTDRLTKIKAAIQVNSSHHKLAFTELKARVDKKDYSIYGGENSGYQMSYLAREAAMMYLLTDDSQYATLAYQTLQKVYTTENTEVRLPSGDAESVNGVKGKDYGLSRAMMCLAFGIAYDWCYNGWTAEQRTWVKSKLTIALDDWPTYSHTNLGGTMGSNWVAVCRGGELVAMLAAEEETARASRFGKLKSDLVTHMKNGYGDMGISQEGNAYCEYAGHFLLSAVHALSSIGDNTLANQVKNHAFWNRAMYSHSFQGQGRKLLMMGVDGTSNYDEGWASLVLGTAPADQLPYLTFWYDRHLGKSSVRSSANRYDFERAGTTWSLIYYPEDVTALNPLSAHPKSLADNRGYYFFRNRWQDENDIMISLHADAHRHDKAWDQSEAGALGILAYDTRFVGGPGKDRTATNYSMLLVDGKSPNDTYKGENISFDQQEDGGYLVVGGGTQYSGLGISSYQRHTAVKFLGGNRAIVAILDKISDESNHVYTFNLNIGDENGNDNVTSSSGTEQQCKYFLLNGKNRGYIKGWVLSPTDAALTVSDPVQVKTASTANAEILVVMLIDSGSAATAQITGSGTDAKLTVLSHDIQVVDGKIQITGPSSSIRDRENSTIMTKATSSYLIPVSLNLSSAQTVKAALYDLCGSKVADLGNQLLTQGKHTFSYSLDHRTISKGVYFLCVQSQNSYLFSSKVILK